jgi:hypothetical protein
LGALARLIAATPSPAAVLVEESSHDPRTRITVRPAEVVGLLRRSVAGMGVQCDPVPGEAPTPPEDCPSARIGYLVRAGSGRFSGPAGSDLAVDSVGITPGLGAQDWLGLQTFWLPAHRGTVWLARRFRLAARSRDEAEARFRALGTAIAAEWSQTVGIPAVARSARLGSRRDWRLGGLRSIPRDGWFERPPATAARTALTLERARPSTIEIPVETPAIVLGATGAGKTTYLARWAAHAVRRGEPLFAVDLHGDLAPAILARLSPEERRRVVAVDATRPPVPGIAAVVSDGPRDRAAAHLVAALKRLTPDGTDLYWGFRLERIFDTVVRLALESGGSLADMYDLLTNPDRRDAARLSTRSVELARFLDELAPVVRRNPEFLWSAATRLSKVMLVPPLRELLSPDDGGLPVEELLSMNRVLLVRLPFASLGPEAAGFAATLVLGRVYFGIAAASERARTPRPVSIVLDEVQAFSPHLVAELLTEGRKFGLRTVIATQYPDRLARELASAARGALRGFVAFRVPRPTAVEVGRWLGLRPDEATEVLPNLPTGEGLVLDTRAEGLRPMPPEASVARTGADDWNDATVVTHQEFSVGASTLGEEPEADEPTGRLLLAVLSAVESGSEVRRENVVAVAMQLPGPWTDPAILAHRLSTLLRDGYLTETEDALRLTAAGERRLGLTVPTGATRESAEHRALLLATFRKFAARGYRLEILRQGRFDTTLPDARFRQLPSREELPVPSDLAAELERRRSGWAWRFFHGRDVHVEAEVSGALRAERIRHGVRKALHRGAFVLFVVGDAHRARRVRTVLRAMGLGVDRAQVWTLRLPPGSTGGVRATNR